jgi:DNA repair protein RadC
MVRINLFTVKQVKESAGLYDVTKQIKSPSDVNTLIQSVLKLEELTVEKFGILTLNTKNVVIGVHIISVGNLNSSIVHPREVFMAAILNNAASIVLFHNHPSGNPSESPEDIQVTIRLQEAGELLGIDVLDHVITGSGNSFVSLKENGSMN